MPRILCRYNLYLYPVNQRLSRILPFLPVLLVYMAGLPVEVMEVDAAQYAEISREMLESGNYLQLFCGASDYLDKPPFLFWTTALSFALFGIHTVAYKLPSLLFTLLGIYATYRTGKKLYPGPVGFYAALMVSTTQAWFMFTNDVRTDTILAGAVIFSIWQLLEYLDNRKWMYFLGATAGLAIAMLTKGPIGLMVPVLALGTDRLLKRDWRAIFRWQWLLMAVLILVCLSPMLWGLYQQYDLHPGKVINGQRIDSGLRFYFWTQSFGRLTGESQWANDPSLTGFLPILGWAFLPWVIFLAIGLVLKSGELMRFRIRPDQEAVTFGGFVFPFMALSMSNYKLPHYIFVLFPLGAILAARALMYMVQNSPASLRIGTGVVQAILALGYLGLSGLLLFWVFADPGVVTLLAAGMYLAGSVYLLLRIRDRAARFILPSVAGALIFNLVMNLHFYPRLLRYQSTSVAAQFYRSQLADEGYPLAAFFYMGYAFQFYAQQQMPYHENPDALQAQFTGQKVWVFTNPSGYEILQSRHTQVLEEHSFDHFRVTGLTGAFLNPDTRPSSLTRSYLILVQF